MSLLAWHFSRLNERLRYGDGRKIVAGETLSVSTPILLRKHGLHASESILDALKHAAGPYIWRVELSGEMVSGSDQVAAEHRKALWGFDATDVLRRFARLCSLDVIHLWDAPAKVREYLETGREDLREAVEPADWAACESVVDAATWSAAMSAHRSAPRSEAELLAGGESVAWLAACEKQRVRLEEMVCAAYSSAVVVFNAEVPA